MVIIIFMMKTPEYKDTNDNIPRIRHLVKSNPAIIDNSVQFALFEEVFIVGCIPFPLL